MDYFEIYHRRPPQHQVLGNSGVRGVHANYAEPQ